MKEKIKENWKLILLFSFLILFIVSYFLFVLDIGINSKYFIKRDFNNAFLYRKTGNCTAFKGYLLKDIEKWGQRCIDENNLDALPIKNFSIKDISFRGNSAFLQVELERSSTTQIELQAYSVTYTMQKQFDRHKFLFLLPQTKWLIDQELRK